MDTPAMLTRNDPRPVLVSVLGGAWILMGIFGALRAVIMVAGIAQGVEIGHHDPNEAIAASYPELVDPAWYEAREQREDLVALQRRAAAPQLLMSILAFFGGLRVLQRKSWPRVLLCIATVGIVALGLVGGWKVQEIGMRTAPPGFEVPPEVSATFWSVTVVNVLLQSLPALIGVALLWHPLVRQWLRPMRTA